MMLNPVYRHNRYLLRGNTWFSLKESIIAWHERDEEIKVVDDVLYVGDSPAQTGALIVKNDTYWTEIITEYMTLTTLPLEFYDEESHSVDADILRALRTLDSRYGDHYAVSVWESDEKDPIKMRSAFDGSLALMMNNVEMAYRRYKPILKAYKDRENALLAQIQSTTSANNRFNDTPQNGGDWSDDMHTTNITQMTTTIGADGDTPIRRLEEVRRLWRSVFDELVNYIATWLIEESNL